MIPRIDSLQKQFQGSVQFVSVTTQESSIVKPFLERLNKLHPFNLVESTGDTRITELFKPGTLPHFAWIDSSGRFLGMTDERAINAISIRSVLAGKEPVAGFRSAVNIEYDAKVPLFQQSNVTKDNDYRFQAVLTGFKEGIGSGLYADVTDSTKASPVRRITAWNLTVAQLYQIAMGNGYHVFGWENTLLQVKDTSRLNTRLSGAEFESWLKENRGYCYELVVPVAFAVKATAYMRHDLELFFPQYVATLQKRPWRCLALKTINGNVNAPTDDGTPEADFDFTGGILRNCNLNVLTKKMAHYFQRYRLPVINNTGFNGRVDLDVNADLSDIAAVNSELARYNLRFEEMNMEQEIMVIQDK
jgi:hypothetical protein